LTWSAARTRVTNVEISTIVDAGLEPEVGRRIYALVEKLLPLPRSLTGEGVRSTLRLVGERVPLNVHDVPSGTAVYDWAVPPEWTVREAYVALPDGRRVVDVADSALHLVGYSVPFRGELTLPELRPHLHTLPDQPEAIPFRTSFYHPSWGFCLTQRTLDALPPDAVYRVVVDTSLEPGSLTYGEVLLDGETSEEVLLTTHVCHPAMANDNASGIALLTELGSILSQARRRYTYRLLFIPGTIGSLTWLSRNESVLDRIAHGVVVTGVGAPGPLVYKRTRHGDRVVDRASALVVSRRGGEIREFSPWGYDERHFNSPGFDLPVGRLTRTPHGEFPEYHTSADDLSFVDAMTLGDSLAAYLEVLDVLEGDATFLNLSPKGEPQLGKRGLYPTTGGRSADDAVMAMLWVLNLSDGSHTLLDIATRSHLGFASVRSAARDLLAAGLLGEA
jgi:aminopeptidase-like protein